MKSRKELREEYKQRKYRMGVFQIKNSLNNKIFVSSSQDLDAIWHAQKLQLNVGIHPNSELQKDWKESGTDNFTFDILEMLKQNDDEKPQEFEKELKSLEEIIVEELQPFENRGYNKKKK